MKNTVNDLSDITGLILAGGQARRLGGTDKGLITLGNAPMIQYSIEAFAPQVQRLLISANRNVDRYREFGYEVLEDRYGNFEGPLAGLRAAMQRVETAVVATLPCDAPLAPPDLVTRLAEAYVQEQRVAAVAYDGRRLQPLFGLFDRALLPGLTDYLNQGRRRVIEWVESLDPVRVDFSDCSEAFRNVNTNEDLESIRRQLAC